MGKIKSILIACILIILCNDLHSQEFVPGYYILNSTAKYSILHPSSVDFISDEQGCYHESDVLSMKSGEVVIAYEFVKGKYYCFDPYGRGIIVQGISSLTKAPILPGCGVGRMEKSIQLIDGNSIVEGAYYWIIGQNIANSTVEILINDGIKLNVPYDNISLISIYLTKMSQNLDYIDIE
jgi:hypothetical protein